MSKHIYVINPNSLIAVTAAIDQALAPLRFADGPQIHCVTLADGPAGIQTQRDVDAVVTPLCTQIARSERDAEERGGTAAAFVIACFSDPGLYSARESTDRPVLGIAECGVLTAMTLGQKFGVVSILQASIGRHWRYFASMGVTGRLAGDIAIGLSVAELADQQRTFARLCAVGEELRDRQGADVLVLGCAGMAAYRAALAEHLGMPVVDPTQAAVAMAMGQAALR
ncbi:aspartate/glutamate racemase family protein [Paraburkholderia susongensis]|uniref:Asp/Glu/hydantoin racemase n=1 Tax=Paraburkholderia susongensis TaxID=1515439 RepID=A0A1X7LYZ6_9BURK|nr:aspartate/glutamate racemase family protein [Paraburkholderia susongensis]SMG59095.1 Asp/Glu/hydantoin racemase [Paraburkholderia susongensis]